MECLLSRSDYVKDLPKFYPGVAVTFGVANHFRNICDTTHAVFKAKIEEAAKRFELCSVRDVMLHLPAIYEEYSAQRVAAGKCPRMEAEFIDFVPDEHRTTFRKDYCIFLLVIVLLSPFLPAIVGFTVSAIVGFDHLLN